MQTNSPFFISILIFFKIGSRGFTFFLLLVLLSKSSMPNPPSISFIFLLIFSEFVLIESFVSSLSESLLLNCVLNSTGAGTYFFPSFIFS